MPGEFLRINNVKRFEQVLSRVTMRMDQDPSQAFSQAFPGMIGQLTEPLGPWRGREEMRMEIPGIQDDARAVARQERAEHGDYDAFHIVALRGMELAGPSQTVYQADFDFGGMPAEKAAHLAARPRRDWNRTVTRAMLDVITQGAFTDGSNDPSEAFAWSVTDQRGNTVTQDLATENSDQVAAVVAHSGQSVNWPLRDGGETSTGHDHVETAAGASWTIALGNSARDNIVEHPGNGRVRGFAGANVAADIRSVAKTEYGAIESRVPLISQGDARENGFGEVHPIAPLESVDYFFAPDMPDDIIVYVAGNKRPVYASVGAVGAEGQNLDVGDWTENLAATTGGEIQGTKWGYRRFISMGVHDPTAIYVQEITA